MKVNLLITKGFSSKELTKINRAVELIEIVTPLLLWRERFLNLRLTSTKGKTNREILEHFESGKCEFTDADGTMDLKVTLYKPRWCLSKVVGYVIPGKWMIWVNRKFFATPVSIMSNILHEYFHQLSYTHVSASEYTSVPYAAGNLAKEICKELDLH